MASTPEAWLSRCQGIFLVCIGLEMFRVGVPREENISCKSLYYLFLFFCRCNFPISEFGERIVWFAGDPGGTGACRGIRNTSHAGSDDHAQQRRSSFLTERWDQWIEQWIQNATFMRYVVRNTLLTDCQAQFRWFYQPKAPPSQPEPAVEQACSVNGKGGLCCLKTADEI